MFDFKKSQSAVFGSTYKRAFLGGGRESCKV